MNKLKLTIAGLLIACFGLGVANAQDKTAAPAAKTTAKKSTKKPASAKASTGAKTTAKPAQHLKKDGSPDMRYKENKAAKPGGAAPAKTGTSTPKKAGTKKAAPKKAAAPAAKPGM